MKIMKKILFFLMVLFFSFFIFTPSIYAHTLEDFYADSDAGWAFKPDHRHMGGVETTYKYASPEVKTTYQ